MDKKKEKQKRKGEKWEMNMHRKEQRHRERLNNKEDEEEEWLKVMFLKCHSSFQLQSSEHGTNGLFEGKLRNGMGEWTS